MIIDVMVTLIINLLLLLSMSFIQQMIPSFKNKYLKRIILGIYTGLVGIVLMTVTFEFYEGMIFDTRSILISSTGIFFGVIPTALTWLSLVSYRLYIGGSGVFAALINISQAAIIGLLFRKFRIRNPKRIENSWKEFTIVSYIIHVIMFLLVFTLPASNRNAIMPHLWYMVLIFLPLGSIGIYLFHKYQTNLNTQKEHIVQYQDIFAKSHVVLMILDPETGKIIDVNKTAVEFYGWSLAELTRMYIHDINTLSKEEVQKEIDSVMKGEKAYFNFKHQTKNKGIIDVEVYSGAIELDHEQVILSTIHDASHKVQNEALILEKQKHFEYIGYHDYLTGLYNRMFFDIELERLNTERQLPLAVIIGDMNNLKETNDKYSHIQGDQLLVEVAGIFNESVRAEDIVARWGGDEFVIILPQSNEFTVKNVIQRINKKCKSSKSKVKPSISLGYYIQTEVEDDFYEGLRKAEKIMYKQKINMKNKKKQ